MSKFIKLLTLVAMLSCALLMGTAVWAQIPANPGSCTAEEMASIPGCNPPINSGGSDQTKAGSLTLGKDLTVEGLEKLYGQLQMVPNKSIDFASTLLMPLSGGSDRANYAGNISYKTNLKLDWNGILPYAETILATGRPLLNIIGGGLTAGDRLVKIWDNLDVVGTTTSHAIVADNFVCSGAGSCGLGGTAVAGHWTASGNNIYNSNTGRVGIGTTDPGSKLHVVGNFSVSKTSSGAGGIGSLNGIVIQDGGNAIFKTPPGIPPGSGGNGILQAVAGSLNITGVGIAPNRKVTIRDALNVDFLCDSTGAKCVRVTNIIDHLAALPADTTQTWTNSGSCQGTCGTTGTQTQTCSGGGCPSPATRTVSCTMPACSTLTFAQGGNLRYGDMVTFKNNRPGSDGDGWFMRYSPSSDKLLMASAVGSQERFIVCADSACTSTSEVPAGGTFYLKAWDNAAYTRCLDYDTNAHSFSSSGSSCTPESIFKLQNNGKVKGSGPLWEANSVDGGRMDISNWSGTNTEVGVYKNAIIDSFVHQANFVICDQNGVCI